MGKLVLACAAIGLLVGAAVGLDGHNKHESGAPLGVVYSTKAMSSIVVPGEAAGQQGRHLMMWTGNGYVYSTSSATYYLYGYVYDSQPTKPEEYPATYIEAAVNCTRMGLDQPDPDSPADVQAAQYLDADHRGSSYGTWIKTKPGGTCSWVTSTTINLNTGCNGRVQYVCVKRATFKRCGGKQCCSNAGCCAGRICCQSGTTCCPPTKKRKHAACVEAKNKCPA